jgi:glycosyltransferase involved in cell wall biosynthesis
MRKANILHIVPDFNYCNGRAKYVFLLCKYLKKEFNNVIIITNGGDSLERLQNNNLKYIVIKSLQSKNIIDLLINIKRLRTIFLTEDIDIIHTHHRFNELISNIAKKGLNRKSVITVLSIISRRLYVEYKSESIIALSESVKNNLINIFKVKPEYISVIPNFIENKTDNFPNYHSSETSKFAEKASIFSAGRFHPEKNFEILIKATGLLKNKNVILNIAGEGKQEKKYKEIASKYGVNLNIIPTQPDLEKYFLESTMCILSSKIDPLPFFMLDTGVHKKPFIGSSVDGIKELIKHKENGLLFEPGNYFDLAEKIEMFLNDPKLMNKCAENLHKEVIENYTPEKIMPQIINIYENLLKNDNKNS